MKMKVIFIVLSSIILMGLITNSCKKDEQEQKEIELPIISELPILYQGVNLKMGECVLIKNQTGLDTIFYKSLIDQMTILQNIDFMKNNVVIGANVFTRGIYKLEHSLIKTDSSIYTYKVKVYYDLTLIAGAFYYGIIINKVPEGILLQCDLIKINE